MQTGKFEIRMPRQGKYIPRELFDLWSPLLVRPADLKTQWGYMSRSKRRGGKEKRIMKRYQLFQTKEAAEEFRKGMKEQGFRYVLWELAKERTHKNSGCVGVLAANDPKYKYSVEWRV